MEIIESRERRPKSVHLPEEPDLGADLHWGSSDETEPDGHSAAQMFLHAHPSSGESGGKKAQGSRLLDSLVSNQWLLKFANSITFWLKLYLAFIGLKILIFDSGSIN